MQVKQFGQEVFIGDAVSFTLSPIRRHKLSRCPIVSDAKTDHGPVVAASMKRGFLFLR